MKYYFRSIMVSIFAIYSIFPSTAYAQDQEDDTVTVDGTAYRKSMPVRWFSNYTEFGEKLRFGTVNDVNEVGFFSLGLDIKEHLSDKDDEKWDEALCNYYMYPECIKILSYYNENSTTTFALGLLYLSGVPNRNISKNQNFLDSDLEKSKMLVGRAADRGLPEALNFRALVTLVEWSRVNPNADVFKIPPSVEQDLKAAASQGYEAAKLNLAALSMDRKNYAEARAIYEELSAGGLADAHYALGVIYLAGYGVPSNYVKAREYFSRAAPSYYKRGRGIEASYNLGMMYFTGLGGDADYKLARQWIGNAAKEKFEPAVAALPAIEKARQNEASIGAAIAALRPGESVQIKVPARPSSQARADPRYNLECPENHIRQPKETMQVFSNISKKWHDEEKIILLPVEVDIYVTRSYVGKVDAFNINAGNIISKIDPKGTFINQLSGGAPNVSCTFAIIQQFGDEITGTCINNYTKNKYDPFNGSAARVDSDGNVNIKNISRSGCCGFIIQDKSGEAFYHEPGFNWYTPGYVGNTGGTSTRMKVKEKDGTWKGGMVTYGAIHWRTINGYADFIIYRKLQYGFMCTYNQAPNFNF